MQLNLIARGRGDVDLIYMVQGGLFLCWQYWIFEQSEDTVPVCEFVTLETIDRSEGKLHSVGIS
jgi:hypothetical protein